MTLAIPDVIRLHPDDNVVIALKDLGSGARVPEVPASAARPGGARAQDRRGADCAGRRR